VDVSIISQDTVTALAPALPYLLSAGAEVGRTAAQKLGEAAWDGAKALWAKLRDKITAQPGGAGVVEALAGSPDDEDARGALRLLVREIVAADHELAMALVQLAAQAKPANASGTGAVAIGGSANGATISTGNTTHNGPQIGHVAGDYVAGDKHVHQPPSGAKTR
jgi:hypothetical protein